MSMCVVRSVGDATQAIEGEGKILGSEIAEDIRTLMRVGTGSAGYCPGLQVDQRIWKSVQDDGRDRLIDLQSINSLSQRAASGFDHRESPLSAS